MLSRCYCDNTRYRYKTYEDCEVCEEWKLFSNFKNWFDENYIEGYDLDKDLLVKNNRIYSPETCLFVPHKLNTLFRELGRKKQCKSVGVTIQAKNRLKIFRASGRVNEKNTTLGQYSTEDEAHKAFVCAKIATVRKMANEYYRKGEIDNKVYNAVINYEII